VRQQIVAKLFQEYSYSRSLIAHGWAANFSSSPAMKESIKSSARLGNGPPASALLLISVVLSVLGSGFCFLFFYVE
jgi:hypothetical protein